MTQLLITLASLTLALTACAVAWRVVAAERRRSTARIRLLASAIEASRPVQLSQHSEGDIERSANAGARLFRSDWNAVPTVTFLRTIGVGSLVFGLALTSILVFSRRADSVSAATRASGGSVAAVPRTAEPLELLALDHAQDGARLNVRGIVRNPASGTARTHLTAVVVAFNRRGDFAASGRATVEPERLDGGAEASFAVTVPDAADVGRYRVSFRTDEGIVAHVDRRVPAVEHH